MNGSISQIAWKTGSLALVVAASSCWAGPVEYNGPRAELRQLDCGGLTRTYRIYVPPTYTGTPPVALVVALHPLNTTSANMESLTGFNRIAEREGFIVVYPDGINEKWEAGMVRRGDASPAGAKDDVAFIVALLDTLASQYHINPGRVYATGMSNGAQMAHKLACECTERFAAIAPVVGTFLGNGYESSKPSAPISVLMINGTEDKWIPWQGRSVGRGDVMVNASVDDTVRFWVTANRCPPNPQRTDEPDRDPSDGTRVFRDSYGPGLGGAEVVLYRIEGGGHTWPGTMARQPKRVLGTLSKDIDASEVIWEFFKSHPRGKT